MVALGTADNAQTLGLSLLGGCHDLTVALGVDSDRLLEERVHSLLGSIGEMGRTENRRSGDDDHVDTGIDDLLVGIETDEAVLVGNDLVPALESLLDTVETVLEHIAESPDGDSVSSIEKVHDCTGATSAAADETNLEFLSFDSLVRKFRDIILVRIPQRSHLVALRAGSEKWRCHHTCDTDLCTGAQE